MKIIDRALEILGKIPTTQIRVVVTLALTIATGVMYFATNFDPSIDWLGFLALMAGLDVAQFHSKRRTSWTPAVQNEHKPADDEIADDSEIG